MKFKYIAWNFNMPTREKAGQIVLPEFNDGRIIIRENPISRQTVLGLMKRPEDDETENHETFWFGFHYAADYCPILGHVQMMPSWERETATFVINVKKDERSKGYGTVLMNAGAEYCNKSGFQTMQGMFELSGDTEARERFYERLDMPICGYDEPRVKTEAQNPLLNKIKFTPDPKATKILNSIPQLMRP
jgi:GNAT superfamily N-acetyltransferase